MRYTVRVHEGEGQISNVLSTDDYVEANERRAELKKVYGKDNVWIADSIVKLLVG